MKLVFAMKRDDLFPKGLCWPCRRIAGDRGGVGKVLRSAPGAMIHYDLNLSTSNKLRCATKTFCGRKVADTNIYMKGYK